MNRRAEKDPSQIRRADAAPEQATAPRRSLVDGKTWVGLQDSIKNIRYSTQTIFKVSGKHLIKDDHSIEPIFLYDNIILGMGDGRLAFLFGEKFEYAGNQLLSEAIEQERDSLAKLVFGTAIAGFIYSALEKEYGKVFDVDEYCDFHHLTFDFELYRLDDAVSQWVCKFLSGQVSLEEAPAELRTTKFQFWKSNHLPRNVLRYQGEKVCLSSVGCFLENVLLD